MNSGRADSRVRVFYTESNVDGTIGGSHYCLLHLIEHLDRTRYEPLVLFYDNHRLVPRFREVAETRVDTSPRPLQWGHGTKLWSALAPARRVANVLRFAARVWSHAAFLRREGIGLAHLNNSVTRHQDWSCSARLADVPCVVHERRLSTRYSALDMALAPRVSLLAPVSRWVRDHMEQRGVTTERTSVMHDGLDPPSAAPVRPEAVLGTQYGVRPDYPVVRIVGNTRRWTDRRPSCSL